MNVYLDDNIASQQLAGHLAKAGHAVVSPSDVGLAGVDDAVHLTHCVRQRLVCLTRDHDDYRALHGLILAAGGRHPGILVVRYDNDPTRDMKPRHIVAAIANLEASGAPVEDQFIILNDWR